MNQSSQGTKASNAHDAVPMFCEHPLKILKAKTIKFWYNEGQLVSVPKGQCMAIEGIQEAVNMIDFKNFPSVA